METENTTMGWETPEQAPIQPPDLTLAKRCFSHVGLACFVILAATSVCQIVLMLLLRLLVPQVIGQVWFLELMTFIPMYCIGVPLGLLVLRGIPVSPPQQHQMKLGSLCICVMISLFLMLAGNWIGIGLLSLIQRLTGAAATNPLGNFIYNGNILVNILFFVVLAPIIEEFIFRKSIIDRTREYGEGISIFVSALLFGLVHGNFSQFFYAFGLGLFFAFLYVRTGKLRYSIFLHMLINFLSSIFGPWLISNVDLDAITNAASDPQALMSAITPMLLVYELYAIILFGLALAGLIILIVQRKRFQLFPTEHQLPHGTELRTALPNVGMILMIVCCAALFVASFMQ